MSWTTPQTCSTAVAVAEPASTRLHACRAHARVSPGSLVRFARQTSMSVSPIRASTAGRVMMQSMDTFALARLDTPVRVAKSTSMNVHPTHVRTEACARTELRRSLVLARAGSVAPRVKSFP